MNAKQIEWLESYLDHGNASKASQAVGITENARQHGYNMRNTLMPFIQANLPAIIGRCAPVALETVFDLAQNCPDPKIQLAAAQDLLNRAGYGQVKKVEVSIHDASEEDLDKEIRLLLKKGNIIEVTAEPSES